MLQLHRSLRTFLRAATIHEMNQSPERHSSLISDCYKRSVRLLKSNSQPSGIIACARSEKAVGRNYASIFGRDAAICSLGMVASEDPELIRYARKSLITLGRYQAPNGQIPKYVRPESEEVDFWYYGCIDATLWWLLAIDFFDRHVPGRPLRSKLATEIRLAVYWLLCQEHQGLFLLQQNEASDWADIMPRSGFVLYSNALWYLVKRQYRDFLPSARDTRYYFNRIFFPFDNVVPDHRRARVLVHYIRNMAKAGDFYLSFVNFSFWGKEIDVFGNILAMLFGLAEKSKASRMVERLIELKVNLPYPVRVVHSPIGRKSSLWRQYMQRYLQNLPHQYHNGGIWPFVGGFWAILLARLGKRRVAWQELERFAAANSVNNWEFNEWFHGVTGEPMGMAGQSWNAAMFVLAFHVLQGDLRFPEV
jgi:glycogen debranching enzyme